MNDWWVSSRHTEHQNIKQACQKITFPSKGSILTLFSFIFFTISNILFRRTFFERKKQTHYKNFNQKGQFWAHLFIYLFIFYSAIWSTNASKIIPQVWNFEETFFLFRIPKKAYRNHSKKWLQMQFMPKIVFLFLRKSWFSINIDTRYHFGCK